MKIIHEKQFKTQGTNKGLPVIEILLGDRDNNLLIWGFYDLGQNIQSAISRPNDQTYKK
jgi:hypothetical protein